jgi:hypothetical protein
VVIFAANRGRQKRLPEQIIPSFQQRRTIQNYGVISHLQISSKPPAHDRDQNAQKPISHGNRISVQISGQASSASQFPHIVLLQHSMSTLPHIYYLLENSGTRGGAFRRYFEIEKGTGAKSRKSGLCRVRLPRPSTSSGSVCRLCVGRLRLNRAGRVQTYNYAERRYSSRRLVACIFRSNRVRQQHDVAANGLSKSENWRPPCVSSRQLWQRSEFRMSGPGVFLCDR